jgi:hypothetical protein
VEAQKKEGGIEPRNKAARLWRTVRPGGADCPHGPRGLSGCVPRTVRMGTTDRPTWAADCPLKLTEPLVETPNNGSSVGSTQTVCPAPADCPPGNSGCLKPRPTKTRKHNGSKTKASKNMKNTRRTLCPRTVRQALADRPQGTDRTKNCFTPKVNTSNPSPDLPTGRSR